MLGLTIWEFESLIPDQVFTIIYFCCTNTSMRNRTESKTYMDFADDLAQQFEDGEKVHAGNIAYLRDFSDDSRIAHDYLMDRIAEMYGVTARDTTAERIVPVDLTQNVGRCALGQ